MIGASDNGHSLSTVFSVSPSAKGHFGKEELGTDFGRGCAPDGSQRERPSNLPANGSL